MKRAIITGASRGIGLAITRMLLEEDWHVTAISRTAPPIRRGEYRHYNWIPRDVATLIDPSLIDDGEHPLGALIHCAGIRGPFGPMAENDPEQWIQTIQTNLIGTYQIVRAALPSLQKSDDGRVLLFSGGGAFGPEPGYSAYAATKGATVSLMESLAVELFDTTVTVNCVAPGFIPTGIHKGTPHESRIAAPEAMKNVVACVRHLLGPAARGLTGRTISAQFDEWDQIQPWTMPYLGDQGTRTRHRIEGLNTQMIRRKRAI